eukprot:4985569-Prymnesium_polylepis.1
MVDPSSRRLVAARLCALGFLVNFQPSEPYLTQYLLHTKNLTDAQLASDVWPWSTTGTFALLLPAALLAEVAGARPVILLGLLCRECTRVVLIFAEGVPWMVVMQVAYAGGVAANTIYFAYTYSVVSAEQYAATTSLVLASYHAGNVVAALLAQALVSSVPSIAADLTPLFYLSWLFTSLGMLAFFFLPPPVRESPPALAHELLRHGVSATLRALRQLFSQLRCACRPAGWGDRGAASLPHLTGPTRAHPRAPRAAAPTRGRASWPLPIGRGAHVACVVGARRLRPGGRPQLFPAAAVGGEARQASMAGRRPRDPASRPSGERHHGLRPSRGGRRARPRR